MAMSQSRPVNLDLKTIRFPIMAISSIIHRVTGVIMFLGAFVVMGLLHESLHGPAGFAFSNDPADNEIYTLSLRDSLTIFDCKLIDDFMHY